MRLRNTTDSNIHLSPSVIIPGNGGEIELAADAAGILSTPMVSAYVEAGAIVVNPGATSAADSADVAAPAVDAEPPVLPLSGGDSEESPAPSATPAWSDGKAATKKVK